MKLLKGTKTGGCDFGLMLQRNKVVQSFVFTKLEDNCIGPSMYCARLSYCLSVGIPHVCFMAQMLLFLIHFPANDLGKWKIAKVFVSLPPMWETWIRLLAVGFDLTMTAVWGMTQKMEGLSLSLSVFFSL